MIIGGYQSLTLMDFPGKLASIVFTKGCMFRCPYCHNPELVEPSDWRGENESEYLNFLKSHRGILDGVVVTGGEPTIHKDLPELIEKIKNMGFAIKLDTNGMNPVMVCTLIEKKLIDYVAMDIKHRWNKYQLIANISSEKMTHLSNCNKTAELIRSSGIQYEWRSTIYPHLHESEDLVAMANWMLPGETYFLQKMNYEKTLRKSLSHHPQFDLDAEAANLRKLYPLLNIATR